MMSCKGCGRKRSWPNLRKYPDICLEKLEKITKGLSQDSRSPGRDLDHEPPKYEAGDPLFAQDLLISAALK
jgi:hypothetical protein